MPSKPPKPCRHPGCPEITTDPSGYCHRHREYEKAVRNDYEKRRGSAASRGYDRRWRNCAKSFLAEHPLCKLCEKENRLTPATLVDHIISVTGPDDPLFWEPDNHQSLCSSCHSIKTAKEDGGFGNPEGRGVSISENLRL